MIVIIDYGLGNLGSIKNMLKKLGTKEVIISSDFNDLQVAEGVILPGVGAFDMAMSKLEEYGFVEPLNKYVCSLKKPILGICLGMQLLGKRSEEGVLPGLGFLDFDNIRLDVERYGLRVPHMGWDYVQVKKESPIVKGIEDYPRYYFVHSYYAVCKDSDDILMTCHYGTDITVAVQKHNIYGVQFHPEKSHKYGMHILRNFVEECK